jgi:hypothetical protein
VHCSCVLRVVACAAAMLGSLRLHSNGTSAVTRSPGAYSPLMEVLHNDSGLLVFWATCVLDRMLFAMQLLLGFLASLWPLWSLVVLRCCEALGIRCFEMCLGVHVQDCNCL